MLQQIKTVSSYLKVNSLKEIKEFQFLNSIFHLLFFPGETPSKCFESSADPVSKSGSQ